MKEKTWKHIISAIVEHKPGVLHGIANMFRRRNFNIETITVGEAEQKSLARMTITIVGSEQTVEQVVKQMNKLIDVVKVSVLDPNNTVVRELALIKVSTLEARARSDIINYTEIFKGHVIDVAHDSLIIEITGDCEKISAFIDLMKPYGVKEIARTGVTALQRGMRSVEMG